MKIKYQAALLTAALALGSCSSDDLYGTEEGALGSVYKPGVEVSNVEKVIKDGPSRASYDISNYILDFYKQGETTPYCTYVYRDMPGTVELPEGAYTVSVRSHDVKKAEWDNPYFTGTSAEFTVAAGEFTEVEPIKCTFSSLKVSIEFGEKLRKVMGDDVQVTVIANDEGKLVYTPSETRSGYFEALDGSVSLVATFTGTVDGHYESITNAFDAVAKGQHRIITYELGAKVPEPDQPQGGVGGSGISIDMDYVDEDISGAVDPGSEETLGGDDEPGKLPDIVDPDDPDDPIPPVPAEAITFGGTLEDGKTYTTRQLSEYNVVIKAEKGISDFVVRISSTDGLTKDTLEGVGLTDEFSLVRDTQYFVALGGDPNDPDNPDGLGFPVGDEVAGKTELNISITGFMELLEALGDNTDVFSMTVTDAEGTTKTLTFTITTVQ